MQYGLMIHSLVRWVIILVAIVAMLRFVWPIGADGRLVVVPARAYLFNVNETRAKTLVRRLMSMNCP
jgi:membrane-associated PAP2 superfamily phosphatase